MSNGKVMNGLRFMVLVALVASGLAIAGCGKAKTEDAKPAVEHTDDDGRDEHKGHNH
jgi:hypothetical protein